MIDKETLNKVCPVPEESAVMNEIKTELDEQDRKSTRQNSSHGVQSRMPSSA